MPQNQTTSSLPGPEQLFMLLDQKKDRFAKLPETAQRRFLHFAFRQYLVPKLKASGLDDKSMNEARDKFTSRMLGQKTEPFSKDFGRPPKSAEEEGPGALASAGIGGFAKLSGMVKHLEGWNEKLDDYISTIPGLGKIGRADKKLSQNVGKAAGELESLYDDVYKAHPTAAKAGAIGADVLASGPAYEGAGIAAQAVKNPLLRGAISGAGGAVASSPLYGHNAQEIGKDALYGAVGGAALSPLAKMLGGASRSKASRMTAPTAEAPKPFKSWVDMTPEEQSAIRSAKQPKGKPSAKASVSTKEGTPTPVAPKDSADSAKWRQEQYVKLKRGGVNPNTYRDQVHAGKSAEDILGAVKTGASVGEKAAATGIALQETPEVEKAVKGVATAAKIGTPTQPIKIPEGQHGQGKLGKNAIKAEAEAKARAKAAAAQPAQEVGFEGSGKESSGTPVPIAPTQIPIVDAISSLHNFRGGGMDGSKLARLIEGNPKFKALNEVEQRAALEKTYQAFGEKLGIEGADSMSLDELYVRLTAHK